MSTMKTNQLYRPWDQWECYKAGFYETPALTGDKADEARLQYSEFLKDAHAFNNAISRVMTEWPNSCDHFLTNPSINRVAWLGQASMCITHGLPSVFKGGFRLLTQDEQDIANSVAKRRLDQWLEEKCRQQSA